MSELQDAYTAFARNVRAGLFSDPDPAHCGCRGSGWFLSDFDTWHECPDHPGRRHPEDQHGYDDEPDQEQPQWTWVGAPWASTSLKCYQSPEEISRDLDWELNAADIPF